MKNIRNAWKVLVIGGVLVPAIASAQTGVAKVTSGLGDIGLIITVLTNTIVKSLATLFATAAMVAFFFGIVQFIWGTRDGDATKAKNGKNFMLWGLIALFVMFSVWGIITYVQQIFGVTQNSITIPTIQINTGSGAGNNNGNGGLPADGTVYWRCNGQVYTTQAAYDAACPNNAGATPVASGGAAGGGGGGSATVGSDCSTIGSTAECGGTLVCQNYTCQQPTSGGGGCSGKSEGTACTVSGRAGTCTTNDEGTFGCYVTTCGVGQVPSANGGCTTVSRGE